MDISFSAPRTLSPSSDLTLPLYLVCRHAHTQTFMQFGFIPFFFNHTGLYNVLFLQIMPASRFHPKPYNSVSILSSLSQAAVCLGNSVAEFIL